ncbi:MAG: NAD(P)/FAD-dependent oxidoreductase [Proteobacteria bacterium]|nr:NAD(P)/FAD-dependent oxidoreductase [Pseudomonadota bacterium]
MPTSPSSVAAHAADVLDVVVIGAGFSGLGMLYQLRKRGYTTRVIEAGDDVGGTWYWNRYPGARCDSPSEVYCFFFDDQLLQDWNWSRRYPDQPEILRYLQHVADRFDLRRDITFDTRVLSAHFDEAARNWTTVLSNGERLTSRYLVTAVGCLSDYEIPDFKGLERFQGEWHHTARWPQDGVDFSGKRVGVIGTGSTGIQAIPVIAESAAHLYVFQRTPNYSIPARDRVMTDAERNEVKAHYREIHDSIIHTTLGQRYAMKAGSAFDVSDAEREAIYEADWQKGGFAIMFNAWEDLYTNAAANETLASFVRRKIAETVKDPKTRELLTPRDHPIGTKRPPLDTRYFETFNRDNVTLVDVRSAPIVEITETSLRTSTDDYPLDMLVFATGFDAMTGALFNIDIRGRGGMALKDKWADGPLTYLGLASHGFPNLFTITGPGSPSVLSNMPISIEQHVEWISDCLEYMRRNDVALIEAEPAAEEEWTRHVGEVAAPTLMTKVESWYMGSNIPGKPRRFVSYLGGVGPYRDICQQVADDGYRGFTLSKAG